MGFGEGRATGGLVYWYTLTQKAARYGLFGIVHDTYLGNPLSVHSWPLAIAFLGKLGYRKYIYLSHRRCCPSDCCALSISAGNPGIALLIPIVILSTYYINNLYIGTWEPLAWSFGLLAMAAFLNQMPVLAGIFIAATLLTHPGVCELTVASIVVFGITQSGALLVFPKLLMAGGVAAGLTVWFLIPYFRSGNKLGRDAIIRGVFRQCFEMDQGQCLSIRHLYIFLLVCRFQ